MRMPTAGTKIRLIPALMALLLLAGCAPSPKGDRAEFDAFVAGVDAARAENAVWTQEEKAVFETYTPDISNQADALTPAELEALFTPHETRYLSREEALLESRQNMYYVPEFYFTETTGLNMDYVKPTIGPDGALTYCFAALSEDGTDLPEQVGDRQNLNWVKESVPVTAVTTSATV